MLLAVGERMPAWVSAGFDEYARRIQRDCRLELREVVAGRRGKGADLARIKRDEGARMLAAKPDRATFIALDVDGQSWSTPVLADRLRGWLGSGDDVALGVGGPEGLSEECVAAADVRWSLSALTLAHPVVRVVVAEQIYRAWSIVHGLPYHRG
jgi:23S rRNA (pseudouridine1915-N3)-methyltransferase